jgi:hypothetical protein
MNTTERALRLGPLPKTETVKLTIALTAALKEDLDRYAALHSETYGEPVEAATLIPHMLEAFIGRDRGFRKARSKTAPTARPKTPSSAGTSP